MKKLTNHLILICFLSFISVFSQSEQSRIKIRQATKVDYLKSFSETQRKKFDLSLNLAYSLAEKNNWAKVIITDSTYSRLVGVSKDLKPVYYITENRGAGITSRADRLYTGGSLGLSIEGQGMLAGVWDAGSALLTHELFSNRISLSDNSPYLHPHSSHVAGTIIGTDAVQNGNARGMAYKGNVNSYDWNNDIAEVATAASNGLLISNHSYGYNPFYYGVEKFGKYDEVSKAFDEIHFNAPYYQMVCAAGNSRIYGVNTDKNGYDLITGHALGKNVITVAAVEEVLNYSGPSSVVMSDFSSWGPSDDGRIKPDISAKGVNTFSAVDTSNSAYDYKSGTSMASPSVAGTLLLFQQYYNQLNNNYMKASTLKGLMIHSADEAGENPGPDYKFGWGLINAEKAATIIKNKNLFSKIEESSLANGETKNIILNSDGVNPLVVTLAWTDPVGNLPSNTIDDPTPNLVNDLDIVISRNGTDYYPWKLNPSALNAAATKGVNNLDNVEKIEINTPVAGTYTLAIKHKGNLVNLSQDYSLIASGIVTNDFWFSTTQNNIKLCKTDANSFTFNFDFHVKNGFSDNVIFSVQNLPSGLSAAFSPTTLSAEGNFILNLTGISTLQKGKYSIVVKGQSGADTFEYPLTFTIYESNIAAPVLQKPTNNNLSVNYNNTEFTWAADPNSESYVLEISKDSNFANKESYNVATNRYSKNLSIGTKYYWRVKAVNKCGEGIFSEIFSFSTYCDPPQSLQLVSAGTTSLTVSWGSNASSGKWEIETVPAGSAPSGTGILVTASPYTITNLTKNTCYDVYIRIVCGEEGSYSPWIKGNNFCTNADYCGGDHFYDSGGENGNYPPGENFFKTLYPQNSTDRIVATFNKFNVESCCSYFTIFDGPNSNSPILFSGTTMQLPYSFRSSHSSGALSFSFYAYGTGAEGWDATISCEPKPACPTIPKNILLTDSRTNLLTFSWEDTSNASQWQVEVVPAGTLPTGVGVAVSQKSFTKSGLSTNTCYDVYVRSICTGGYSDWSNPARLCTSPDYCAGDHFYDSGGANGNYKDYENLTKTIYPEISGNRVRAIFNEFSLESCCDKLIIYNGPDKNAPVLFNSGSMSELPSTFRSTHASGALTFTFTSDGSSVRSGWDAQIICEPIPACSEYPKSIALQTAALNSLTINWTDNSNANQWEIEAVKNGSNPTGHGTIISSKPYTISGLESNTIYKIYIRSLCSAGTSEWSVSANFTTLANYCGGDHFYDTGGALGGYSNNYESYTKTIYPSQNGDRVKAIFDLFDISQYDQFTVYNGPNSYSSPVLYSSYGNTAQPGTLSSTDLATGALTFSFYTSGNVNNKQGWDARIICEKMPPCPNAPGEITLQSSTVSTMTVNWPENSNATQWEIEIVKDGNTPSGSGTIINTRPYTLTGLQSNTCYKVYIRSVCSGGNSSWTVSKLFCTQGNYCAGDHFYDSGGALSGYPTTSEFFIKTIYPSTSGNRVKAVFDMFDINQYDNFTIYNGEYPSSDQVLYNYNYGNSGPPTTVSSTAINSGALTFYFSTSGNNSNKAGWDARIICEPMPACPNPPSNIYLQNSGLNSLTFNWTDNSNASQWEVEAVKDGDTPTGIGTITSSRNYTITGLLRNTCYKVYIRSVCTGGKSEWGVSKLVCTQADYCAGDHFYDLGGKLSNYPNNESLTKTIYPTGNGNRVKAIFDLFDINQYDQFMVFDGPYSYSTALLYNSYNNPNVPGTIVSTDPSGALTFIFSPTYSNNNQKAGWDAQIICEPMPPCAKKPTLITLEQSTFNSLKISWTENSNATQWEIETVKSGQLPTGQGTVVNTKSFLITNLQENTCYDIYVRSKCTTGNSEWTKSATSFCTTPSYCGNHFYDSGGANESYKDNENWIKTIYPMSAGKLVSASFSTFNLESCCDKLTIYNGPDVLSPVLFSSGNMDALPKIFKSSHFSGALTFKFTSDSSVTYPGWDALINCDENLSVEYSEKENIKIFPNPVTTGALNIDSPVQIKRYEIFDASSRMIIEKQVSGKNLKIDVGHFVSGHYVIKLIDQNSEIHTFKIIKQ